MTAALRDALTLDQARRAARSGDLDRAARLLDGLATPTVAGLDLRARVHAQRGDLDRADECWEQVLGLDPDHADAQRGRATIARIRRRRRPVRVAAVATVAAALVAGGVAVASSRSDPSSPPSTPAAASSSTSPSPSISSAPPVDPRQERLDRVTALFAGPGVRAERRTDDVRLVFVAGLFTSDLRLADGSRAVLRSVGGRLRQAGVTVTVVGHTVPVAGGRTSGGSTTAYARAQTVAGLLSTASGLPLTTFTLATADQSEGPWPEPDRNRTVTLLLRPTDG